MAEQPRPNPEQPPALREVFRRSSEGSSSPADQKRLQKGTGLPKERGVAPGNPSSFGAAFLKIAKERAAARRTPPAQPSTGPQKLEAAPPAVALAAPLVQEEMMPQEILTPEDNEEFPKPATQEQPPPSQRGESLRLETVQRIRTQVAEIQTEKDPIKQRSMIEALSQSLQADSQQSPQPLKVKVEETKALITEELLGLGEENLLNLLRKYNGLQKALEMLRDRDVNKIKDSSAYLKALSSRSYANEILRLLAQKQPPAQSPTGPLFTKDKPKAPTLTTAEENTREPERLVAEESPPGEARAVPEVSSRLSKHVTCAEFTSFQEYSYLATKKNGGFGVREDQARGDSETDLVIPVPDSLSPAPGLVRALEDYFHLQPRTDPNSPSMSYGDLYCVYGEKNGKFIFQGAGPIHRDRHGRQNDSSLKLVFDSRESLEEFVQWMEESPVEALAAITKDIYPVVSERVYTPRRWIGKLTVANVNTGEVKAKTSERPLLDQDAINAIESQIGSRGSFAAVRTFYQKLEKDRSSRVQEDARDMLRRIDSYEKEFLNNPPS